MDVFPPAILEGIAKVMGEVGTGSDIDRAVASMRWQDDSGHSTKWRRLDYLFQKQQSADKSPNAILAFIQSYLTPVRFADRNMEFETFREQLNYQLLFVGLEYRDDGQFISATKVKTITEAERRLDTLKSRLRGRSIHPKVLEYCKSELLQDNYFHAVFEAAKGLAQRIRELSGVEKDGAILVDTCFSVEHPILAFNTLQTETEQSEQKGFAHLMKGCFQAIRNPLAHEPKILWTGEEDAVDYLTLISMLHRKLDTVVRVRVFINE